MAGRPGLVFWCRYCRLRCCRWRHCWRAIRRRRGPRRWLRSFSRWPAGSRCCCFKASAGESRRISATLWWKRSGRSGGATPCPAGDMASGSAETCAVIAAPDWLARLDPRGNRIQFLPLVWRRAGDRRHGWRTGWRRLAPSSEARCCDVHRQTCVLIKSKQAGRGDEQPQDPEAEPDRLGPDSRPRFVARRRVDDADRGDQRQDKPVDLDRARRSCASPPP